jgi:drug/metabolite transporter (DMT)-like permease
MVKKYLSDLKPRAIVTGNFLLIISPALIVLYFTDFFTTFKYDREGYIALGYLLLLAIFGTGLAKIIYNKLVQIATPVFSSSVTYLIPIVAIFWGVLDGETLGGIQILGALIILLGVFLVNRNK